MIGQSTKRVFVALDSTRLEDMVAAAKTLKGAVGGIKIGKEFFTACGPAGVRELLKEDMPLFLDLKFHDIPNTVAGAVRAATALTPLMLNVHAAGGGAMMRAAAEAAGEGAAAQGCERPLVLGVTVLTSLDENDLKATGIEGTPADQVKRLAALSQECGLDGVVCSGEEIESLRTLCGPNFKLVVPGIRPSWAAANDQKRILTPSAAVEKGADYLVIGRAITTAADPVKAAQKIAEELDLAA
jgi:orotidine-5'-phosphate decarboxylase